MSDHDLDWNLNLPSPIFLLPVVVLQFPANYSQFSLSLTFKNYYNISRKGITVEKKCLFHGQEYGLKSMAKLNIHQTLKRVKMQKKTGWLNPDKRASRRKMLKLAQRRLLCLQCQEGQGARIHVRNQDYVFSSSSQFFMATVCLAMGKENLKTFSYYSLRFGGIQFFVVYLLMFSVIGVPILTIECILGQYSGTSMNQAHRLLTPAFTFIGFAIAPLAVVEIGLDARDSAKGLYYAILSPTRPFRNCKSLVQLSKLQQGSR